MTKNFTTKRPAVVNDKIQSDLIIILCQFFFDNDGQFSYYFIGIFIPKYHKITKIHQILFC